MDSVSQYRAAIPSWNLYGEQALFPDVLHSERIHDRAAGLDWRIDPHRHPLLHQFFLIEQGDTSLLAENQTYQPDPPCIISIPSGVVHGFDFASGTEGYVITIPMDNLTEVFSPSAVTAPAMSRLQIMPAGSDIIAACEKLHEEHRARGIVRSLHLRALATEIACLVARSIADTRQSGEARLDPRFEKLVALIDEHLQDNWQATQFADAINLSTRQLARLCVKETGTTVTHLLEAARMQEARRRLAYTRTTIANIAYELGFDDPSYFSRRFRKHFGQSPKQYRARIEIDEAIASTAD
ncbi:helix-turn-helix domain-containing protein [Poseidonocella pacifica]|nr:helix-turn-helix domain-containing protein [Poseidonocella pacifica]